MSILSYSLFMKADTATEQNHQPHTSPKMEVVETHEIGNYFAPSYIGGTRDYFVCKVHNAPYKGHPWCVVWVGGLTPVAADTTAIIDCGWFHTKRQALKEMKISGHELAYTSCSRHTISHVAYKK